MLLVVLGLALIINLVIVIWAALIMGKPYGSDTDQRIYLSFAGAIPAELLLVYLGRGLLVYDYFSGFFTFVLVLTAWLGSLMLCVSGIRWTVAARQRQESLVTLLLATCLSGLIFLAGLIGGFRQV